MRSNRLNRRIAIEQRRLRESGLNYVSDESPGIRRLRRGDGFCYVDVNGHPLRQTTVLGRIKSLAIPPAYTDVWICADAEGHLQATGYDKRGRKQYRYHVRWRAMRDRMKFERMSRFGAALPRLRARLRVDLKRPGLPKEKVVAAIVALLDAAYIRIGNDQYERENGSYGLTTLQNRHAEILPSNQLSIRFRGKGGQQNSIVLNNPLLVQIVRDCQRLRGQRLFQYVDEAGKARTVDSAAVNAYISKTMMNAFTAKDFRTWNATLRATALLCREPPPRHNSTARSVSLDVVRAVAQDLQNTPAICRKSYINPVIFEAWTDGLLRQATPRKSRQPSRRLERWMVGFLRRMKGTTSDRLGHPV